MADIKRKMQVFLQTIKDDLDRTMEFWLKHSHDEVHGGFFSCLSERGDIYDELKYGWLQARQTEAMNMLEKIKYWTTVDDSELGRPILEGSTAINSLGIPMMVLCIIDQMLTMDASLNDSLKDFTEWAVNQTLAHVQRNGKFVLEHVSCDGKELPGSQGRLTVPGHVIECGWFLLKVAQRNNDEDLIKLATETFIMKSFANGWDKDNGGLLYFLDVDGWSPTQLEWNMKLWWPQNEAMISFLMAFQQTKDQVYLDKFEQVFNYAYDNFVDKKHGEWYGYLNQEGKINMSFKGGPFKGCFHVPRALMMCEQILEQLLLE